MARDERRPAGPPQPSLVSHSNTLQTWLQRSDQSPHDEKSPAVYSVSPCPLVHTKYDAPQVAAQGDLSRSIVYMDDSARKIRQYSRSLSRSPFRDLSPYDSDRETLIPGSTEIWKKSKRSTHTSKKIREKSPLVFELHSVTKKLPLVINLQDVRNRKETISPDGAIQPLNDDRSSDDNPRRDYGSRNKSWSSHEGRYNRSSSRPHSRERRPKNNHRKSCSQEQRSQNKQQRSHTPEGRSRNKLKRFHSRERTSGNKQHRSRSCERRSGSKQHRSRSRERRSGSKQHRSRSRERRSESINCTVWRVGGQVTYVRHHSNHQRSRSPSTGRSSTCHKGEKSDSRRKRSHSRSTSTSKNTSHSKRKRSLSRGGSWSSLKSKTLDSHRKSSHSKHISRSKEKSHSKKDTKSSIQSSRKRPSASLDRESTRKKDEKSPSKRDRKRSKSGDRVGMSSIDPGAKKSDKQASTGKHSK